MLGRYDAGVSLAVSDMKTARGFYVDKLGLTVEREDEYESVYSSGHVKVQVYVSNFVGSNKATSAFWVVDNLEAEVAELRAKGVVFEHYADMPGIQLEGDIHVAAGGSEKAAWFKDPDGNILCIQNRAQ